MSEHVRIGTRGSDLAMWQAHWVQRELLKRHPDLQVSIYVIKTKGDKIVDSPLSTIGDKGLFTREIELALLSEKIDLAVHSLKDLPTELPQGLSIGAVCEREDVRDVFIPHPSNAVKTLLDQPHGARVATGSLRRRCQLLGLRPDFTVVDIRGNLNTRMKKLEKSDWAGMILARAGVTRLGWESRIGETLDAELLLPAVGQGALAVEVRAGDQPTARLIAGLTHVPTLQATTAERSLLRTLEGGCQIPVGAFAKVRGDGDHASRLSLVATVGSLDGATIVRARTEGDPERAEFVGRELAETLLEQGADKILEQIRPHQELRPVKT